MATLDTPVTVDLVAELLQPGPLRATLASLWAPNAERMAEATAAKVRCVANSSQLNRLMEDGKDKPDG
ncbi:hypothetical protein [Methylobacterium sp. WL8]|uniref:hypothetical protein n=1 Tax=Methylobacterium sp. WL8 TaxID=2603899 RepID=UPI0011C873A0|nr:hypothetical protein [Methylobacterium sp. WL8]TXN80990.1 hypothetical protein FV234_15035 [Methylobacterium sp. WL8]